MEVEAIEDNKIVRLSEEYARLQGLLIIRKKIDSTPVVQPIPLVQLRRVERRARPQIEEFRKPLNYKKNNVLQELKKNFQWDISRKRREKNMSRRKLAEIMGESEDTVINLENGFLPRDNFILLNKVEKTLGISVRKTSQTSVPLAHISKSKESFEPVKGNVAESQPQVSNHHLSEEEIDLELK